MKQAVLLFADYYLPSYVAALLIVVGCRLLGREDCWSDTFSVALAVGTCDIWYQIAVRRSGAIVLRWTRMFVRCCLLLSIVGLAYCIWTVVTKDDLDGITGLRLWREMLFSYFASLILAITKREVRIVLTKEAN